MSKPYQTENYDTEEDKKDKKMVERWYIKW